MKKLSIIAALAVAVLSAGCSETQNDQVAKIREFTVRLCSFMPSVQSVTAILAAANPAVTGTLQIATAICDAVSDTPVPPPGVASLKSDGECPKVNDVCVEGEWVAPGEKEDKE
jgi:PBP1b-binding outer membrane lipoprotein LpoB